MMEITSLAIADGQQQKSSARIAVAIETAQECWKD
jgi:hypothetical protein